MPRNQAEYSKDSSQKSLGIFSRIFQKKYLAIFSGLLLCVVSYFFFVSCTVSVFTVAPDWVSQSLRRLQPLKSESTAATSKEFQGDFNIFYDSFSGLGRIDLSQTNLYLNTAAAAVMFSPDYSLEPTADVDGGSLFLENINDFSGPYREEFCLGENCLNLDGLELYYNKKIVKLPARIKINDLKTISIGRLQSKWLVGFTIKYGEQYRGEVYYFDGTNFKTLILPKLVMSPDPGVFGFGGEDNDFLVIYGAYQGVAYRYRGANVQDLTKFFDIRVMKDGFKAEVVKIKNGADTNWYVFSKTSNRPQFLKLWQNGTDEIAGEVVFDLTTAAEQVAQNKATEDRAISFKLKSIQPMQVIFSADIKNGQEVSRYDFIDRGFKNGIEGTLTFLPIFLTDESPLFTLEKIKTSRVDLGAGSQEKVKLFFSSDEKNWRELPFGQNFDFKTGPDFFNNFRLKMVFSPETNKFYSPFLEEFLLEYYCDKKESLPVSNPL